MRAPSSPVVKARQQRNLPPWKMPAWKPCGPSPISARPCVKWPAG